MAATKFSVPPSFPAFSFRWITTGLIVIGVLVFIWTGFYTVPAESEAVVLRFGRFSHVAPAGLHFKLPLGIDISRVVPVKRQLKQEFGFGTPGATNREQSSDEMEWLEEKSMVTGDLNAAQRMLELEEGHDAHELVDDLIVFATSDRYSALRKRVGIAVPNEA